MKDSTPVPDNKSDLATIPNIFHNRPEIGADVVEPLGDLAQSTFNLVNPGPEALAVFAHRLTWLWWSASSEYRVEMFWMPAKRYRERFKGPGASSPLNRVVLNLVNDGPGYLRALCQLALGPTELVYPLVDGSGNSRPVVHTFLRAPPSRRG